jgi:hypothetical protein
MEPMALHMLGKYPTFKPLPQPLNFETGLHHATQAGLEFNT